MKNQFVGIEAIMTLNDLIMAYLDEFDMHPKSETPGVYQTTGTKGSSGYD